MSEDLHFTCIWHCQTSFTLLARFQRRLGFFNGRCISFQQLTSVWNRYYWWWPSKQETGVIRGEIKISMDKEAYDFGLEIFLRLDLERRSVWSLQATTPTKIFFKKKHTWKTLEPLDMKLKDAERVILTGKCWRLTTRNPMTFLSKRQASLMRLIQCHQSKAKKKWKDRRTMSRNWPLAPKQHKKNWKTVPMMEERQL